MDLLNVIIFSKDRPAQLDALLRSIRERVEGWEKRSLWSVILATSTPEFAQGYEIVRAEHRSGALEFIDERSRGGGFSSIVIETMQRQHQANDAPWCMFLVDDMIFKTLWPLDGGKPMRRLKEDPRVLCLSLRMCRRYDYCYPIRKRMKSPFAALFGRWNWRKASGDWGYPMSLDGHIFRYDDIFPLVQQIEFKNPNTFESKLDQNRITTRPLMTCYAESVVVNLPVNRVQNEYTNRAGEKYGVSAEDLNASFLAGKRVNLAPIYALKKNRSCHHELPLQLQHSGSSPQASSGRRTRQASFPEASRATAFCSLLDCLSHIPSGGPPIDELTGNFRWSTFVALAHEYRVSCAVSSAIEGLTPSDSQPREIKALFSGIADHNRRRNERVHGEAFEVAEILNAIGVTPLFMKGGAHLLTRLYPDAAMRQMADLDILVPATRVDGCVAALKGHGFTELTTYRHPRSHHNPPLGRADLPVPIELHHSVLAYPHGDFLTPDEMYSSALLLSNCGVRVAAPSPTHATLHNIAHAQLNDRDCLYGRVDLRGLLDLALLENVYGNRIDWDLINQRFIDARHRHAFEYHIQWARRLGATVPSLGSISPTSKLLWRRALYQVRKPKMLSLSVRLLRPFVLLRRELSEPLLRQRLVRNILRLDWWKRHLRLLKDG